MAKLPNEIDLKVTRYDIEDGIRTGSSTYKCKLSDKLTEYVTKLEYTNAAIYNVMVHLMSEGKIRLDFRAYIERIELADPLDKLSRV